jgi:hypothetical protein
MEYEFYNRFLTNLDQLSHVTYGQKVTINDGFLSNDTSAIQSISRKFTGQGRSGTTKAVKEVIYASMEFCKILYEFMIMSKNVKERTDDMDKIIREKNNMYKKLFAGLDESMRGVTALIGTYSADTPTRSQLENIHRDLKMFLADNSLEKLD